MAQIKPSLEEKRLVGGEIGVQIVIGLIDSHGWLEFELKITILTEITTLGRKPNTKEWSPAWFGA